MADLTLTVNDTHIPRIQDAFGRLLGLQDEVTGAPRVATAEEVRQYLIGHLRERTLAMERAQLAVDALDIT